MGFFNLDWFWRLILWSGLYQKHAKLLLLGLDNAGKTTLLHLLAQDVLADHAPTQRAAREEVTVENIHFECFDLGGHEEARMIWADFFVDADAIIYIVDATDAARFAESRAELNSLLTDTRLKNVPVLVLGNKTDQPHASESEMRDHLGLMLTTGKNAGPKELAGLMRPIEVFMCSLAARRGFAEGIHWLAQFI